nr:hypothetical protein [Tanacetum cinerariifolium]
MNYPPVNRNFFTGSRNFPTANRKFSTVSRKFPTGCTKSPTADMGMKGKAIKPSACWSWKPSQNLSNKGLKNNSGSSRNKIDDKGYWDSGCSRHMAGNISYLSDYEPFDEGYVSFGQGGCKIIVKGTIKTGTNDTASQEVKKDVSSLRYIALPNWAHDALLEFSSSKPQDHYSTEVPEGSGNTNPTASTSNPPADHMKTLTVESPIPTVSSPVPTAYSTDSQDSSSERRLILKRVTNQEETPSLDNILTLSNRFEDILGATTNSNESNGVEADVSNLETSITASPTPTLIIHRDHPKSQIIGHVDTPIQTRNKSKEIFDAFQDLSLVKAMQEELLQFKIQKVWSLVDCPKGVRPIGTKWALKNKKDERGIVIRNKARLVAQGHTQEDGIDYDEMNVKSAFLYGTIDEEVYVMQPPGFQDPEYPAKVYKVEKAMYGLHQAPRAWYGTLSKYLLNNGFQRGTIDQTLFIRRQRGDFILVQVYMDDIIFGSSNPQLCREFEALMHEKFQMSAMGELNFFLGLQVLQKEDGIFLSQDKYVGDILKKFGYSDVRSSNTPMDKENPWGKDGTGKDVDLHFYRSMIGSLMYLTASRPDIMFAVYAYARHQVTPKECHLHAVKRIFRYLKGHPKLGLWYPKDSPFDLVAYSDSDYGGATQDCKSTTEGCQFLGRRLISCQCKKQTIVATSTTEAEYVAAASCCGQVLDCFEKKLINVDHIYTDENVADLLAKPFDAGRIQYLVGEGSGTLTKPHHTPSQEAQPSSHTHISSPSIPTVSSVPTALIPTVTPSETTPIRQYTRRPRIAQSSTLPLVTDKHASRLRDVSQGEACPTESGFIADQDRTTIAKSSTLPHDSATRVTSPAAAQEVEINKLKERVKLLEDGKRMAVKGSGDDAPIKRRRFDEEEVATERVSNDTEEIRLDEGEIVVPTASTTISTATPIFATATTVTPYTRRKGKEKMVETHTPKKKKRVQEKIDIQFSRELEEELEREAQRMNAQISRDEEIAKIHPEEELQQMIAVKETLSIRPATDEKEMELWVELKRLYEPDVEDHLWTHSQHIMHAPIDWRLYGTCGVHHVMFKDLEIFMLVEKNYPLRKALAFVMICYKLQVENYSQMATDLVRKIQQIAGTPSLGGLLGIKCTRHSYYQLQSSHYQKNFPLPKKKEDRTAINVKKKLPVKDGS